MAINHGVGLFGHGSRANATIGRALRLMMINLGDGRPDTGDKSTMGSPSKYSYCMGADADTPWAPIHADFGFDADESCVTVFAADGPRGNNPAGSGSMEFALWVLADSLRNLNPNMIHGGHTLVVISPLIAHGLHAEGWTKRDAQLYLYEKARVPIERVRRYKELRYGRNVEAGEPYFWPKWLDVEDPTEPDPMIPNRAGPGQHSDSGCGGSGEVEVGVLPGAAIQPAGDEACADGGVGYLAWMNRINGMKDWRSGM